MNRYIDFSYVNPHAATYISSYVKLFNSLLPKITYEYSQQCYQNHNLSNKISPGNVSYVTHVENRIQLKQLHYIPIYRSYLLLKQ